MRSVRWYHKSVCHGALYAERMWIVQGVETALLGGGWSSCNSSHLGLVDFRVVGAGAMLFCVFMLGWGSWFAGSALMSQLCPGASWPGTRALEAWAGRAYASLVLSWGVTSSELLGPFYSVRRHLGLGVKSCDKADGKCRQMQELIIKKSH